MYCFFLLFKPQVRNARLSSEKIQTSDRYSERVILYLFRYLSHFSLREYAVGPGMEGALVMTSEAVAHPEHATCVRTQAHQIQPPLAQLWKPGRAREGRGSSLVARVCSSAPPPFPRQRGPAARKTSQNRRQCRAGWNPGGQAASVEKTTHGPVFLQKHQTGEEACGGERIHCPLSCIPFFHCLVTLLLVSSGENPGAFVI